MTGYRNGPGKVGWELYDLAKDPFELRNVYSEPSYGSVVEGLKQELVRLKSELGDLDSTHPRLEAVRAAHWK